MEAPLSPAARPRVIALIPARGGSKSIPQKNIRMLNGKPLLHWTLGAACAAELIDAVYVATDDQRIADCVAAFGHPKARAIARSPETATDTASSESVLLEFARQQEAEHIVMIQATSPLLQSTDLDGGLRHYFSQQADSLLSVVRQKRFLWETDARGQAQPLNYVPARRPRRQEFAGFLVENGAFYVTKRSALLASNCRLSGRMVCYEMAEETYVELDEPVDWEIIASLLQHRQPGSTANSTRAIKLVLTDVDGVLTDAGMYYDAQGDALKKFNTRDGLGMEMLRRRGIQTGIITGEKTEMVAQRARKLKVDVLIQGCQDKWSALQQLLAERKLQLHEVAYIGDDLNDVEVLGRVGFAAVPADAMPAARARAHYVCSTKGGAGCFREFAERILRDVPAPAHS